MTCLWTKHVQTYTHYRMLHWVPYVAAIGAGGAALVPLLVGCAVWHPRCLHSSCVFIVCIMCLNCLKKDLFVNIKVICVIIICFKDSRANFVEGVFVKCSVIITWQEYFQFSLSLKWNCFEKDKIPRIQNPSYVFKISSWIFDQINFCTTSKL